MYKVNYGEFLCSIKGPLAFDELKKAIVASCPQLTSEEFFIHAIHHENNQPFVIADDEDLSRLKEANKAHCLVVTTGIDASQIVLEKLIKMKEESIPNSEGSPEENGQVIHEEKVVVYETEGKVEEEDSKTNENETRVPVFSGLDQKPPTREPELDQNEKIPESFEKQKSEELNRQMKSEDVLIHEFFQKSGQRDDDLVDDLDKYINGNEKMKEGLRERVVERLRETPDLFSHLPQWRYTVLSIKSSMVELSNEELEEFQQLKLIYSERNRRKTDVRREELLNSEEEKMRLEKPQESASDNQPKERKRDLFLKKAKRLFGVGTKNKDKMEGMIVKEISSYPENPSFNDCSVYKTFLLKNTGKIPWKNIKMGICQDWIAQKETEIPPIEPGFETAVVVTIKNKPIARYLFSLVLFVGKEIISNEFPTEIKNKDTKELKVKVKQLVELFSLNEEKTKSWVAKFEGKSVETLVEMLDNEDLLRSLM